MGMRMLVVLTMTALLGAQVRNPTQQSKPVGTRDTGTVPIYRINVVSRNATAINYRHRSGKTKIGFQGTVLLPEAKGKATVEAQKGAAQIDAKFERLDPPARFGRQYLTYVLWAVTPEGRASNLGEIITDESNKGALRTSTEMQAFALIVTAEPYYAVTQPSDVVVLENVVKEGNLAGTELVTANYELLKRGEYHYEVDGSSGAAGTQRLSLDRYEALLQLYQARNAVGFARSQGADRYASGTFSKAEELLEQAENAYARKARSKDVVTTARQASQAAEDARIISLKRKQSETRMSEAKSLTGPSQSQ